VTANETPNKTLHTALISITNIPNPPAATPEIHSRQQNNHLLQPLPPPPPPTRNPIRIPIRIIIPPRKPFPPHPVPTIRLRHIPNDLTNAPVELLPDEPTRRADVRAGVVERRTRGNQPAAEEEDVEWEEDDGCLWEEVKGATGAGGEEGVEEEGDGD